jgi:hypothetical protein
MQFRLGRFTAYGFETDVGKSTFYAIHNGLEQYKERKAMRRTLEDVYYSAHRRRCFGSSWSSRKVLSWRGRTLCFIKIWDTARA